MPTQFDKVYLMYKYNGKIVLLPHEANNFIIYIVVFFEKGLRLLA